MPLISFDYQDFSTLLGHHLSKEELVEKLPMLGGDLDSVEGDIINIEFFPNRPDLTSVEGIVRASRAFFGFSPGLATYITKKSDVTLIVDSSVKKIRPFVVSALVTNVTMTDTTIRSLMELQEKLHVGLGRNRKKVAIGVHDFKPIKPPFTYTAVDPDAISFIPLAKTEPMTLREILAHHEKGIEYADLLKSFDAYPIILDANNNVLSFPPIINGSLTEVTPATRDIFIDVTGTDEKAIHSALTIVVAALAERGGHIYTTTVRDGKKTMTTPDFSPRHMTVSCVQVNKKLGVDLTNQQIAQCLARMGYATDEQKDDTLQVQVPAWRSDILHEIDLIEDVAVGYGYDRFQPEQPKGTTFGKTLPNHQLYETLRLTLIGLGFNEVTTFTISNEHDELVSLGLSHQNMVHIANPIGEEYSRLRMNLLPSLLKLLRENRHHPLPQRIFELGVVVNESAKNTTHLAAVVIDAKAHFTQSKSLVEAVLREVNCSYSLQEKKHGAFIEGRCAAVIHNKKEVGFFGEIHPQTIQNFSLEHPIIAFELFVDHLFV
ncbi:MAG: phenylalanine--tRNA ligase subunit beta [Candidatus Thermoplasmatota archaeon]